MDHYCPNCGEPWDNDSFHDEADSRGTTYREVMRDFQQRGCPALYEATCAPLRDIGRASASAALMDLMGDDMDGVAAMMEDAEYLGLF